MKTQPQFYFQFLVVKNGKERKRSIGCRAANSFEARRILIDQLLKYGYQIKKVW